MKPISVDVAPLEHRHDRASFDSGEPALDAFFRRNARQNQDRGFSRTYVATVQGVSRVVGFYTLASGMVSAAILPEAERRRLPHYPVPAVQLARLAVDRAAHGGGVGKSLLSDALRRSIRAAEIIASTRLKCTPSTTLRRHSIAALASHRWKTIACTSICLSTRSP
ncbi:MAG TPA: hypothetical protein VF710_20235 [Longimicrobium sp.]